MRKIHKKLHVFVQVNFHFFFTWSKLMAFSWLLAYEEYSLRNGAKYLKASPIVVCSMYSNRVLFTSMICSMLLKMLLWTSSGIRQLNRKGKSKCWKIQTPYYTCITYYNHSKLLQKTNEQFENPINIPSSQVLHIGNHWIFFNHLHHSLFIIAYFINKL